MVLYILQRPTGYVQLYTFRFGLYPDDPSFALRQKMCRAQIQRQQRQIAKRFNENPPRLIFVSADDVFDVNAQRMKWRRHRIHRSQSWKGWLHGDAKMLQFFLTHKSGNHLHLLPINEP